MNKFFNESLPWQLYDATCASDCALTSCALGASMTWVKATKERLRDGEPLSCAWRVPSLSTGGQILTVQRVGPEAGLMAGTVFVE